MLPRFCTSIVFLAEIIVISSFLFYHDSRLLCLRLSVLFILVVTAIVVYCLRTLVFALGAWRERKKGLSTICRHCLRHLYPLLCPPASENNIENCVLSLMQSDYPPERFEVVIVNDRSTDRIDDILRALHERFPNLVVHNTIDDRTNTNLQGKPRTVHQGIMRSQGEFVLMTDADCTVPPTWISAIVIPSKPAYWLNCIIYIGERLTLFDLMQMLEWLINNTMASAGRAWANHWPFWE